MNDLYKPCHICGGYHAPRVVAIDESQFTKLNLEALRIANSMYAGTWDFNQKIDPALTKGVAEHLSDAVLNGFGKGFPDLDFDSPDFKMLLNLEKNVYQFSAAKNYHQLQDMNRALKDASGNLRPFNEFVKEVQTISKVYNRAWLETEYRTANNGATLAARWNDYQENADVMPYLQYETVGDGRVRDDHAALDGVIKPIDDPFWNTWYPPNGFNCRCTVLQLTAGSVTPDTRISYPEVPPMFRTNLAKQQLVFPKGHPYWDMPKKDLKVVREESEKLTPRHDGR